MKKLLIAGALALGIASSARAQAPVPTIESVVRLTDAYSASRGFRPSRQTSVQPTLKLYVPAAGGMVTGVAWANHGIFKQGFPEFDYGFAFARDVLKGRRNRLELTGGWLHQTDLFCTYVEFQGQAKVSTPYLHATLFGSHDYRDGAGQYVELSLGKSFGKKRPVSISGAGMYNRHYAVKNFSGVVGYKVQAEIPVPVKLPGGAELTVDLKRYQSTADVPCFRSHTSFGVNIKRSFRLGKAAE